MVLSNKQTTLLNKVFMPFQEKYNITLDEFTNKFSHKNAIDFVHRDFFFLINKVNRGYDYWDGNDGIIFKPIKISFKNLQYINEYENDDYIIGEQIHRDTGLSMKIICFKKLMILDYDDITIADLEEILHKFPYTFSIYKTHRGYHVYCLSKEFDYMLQDTLQLMFDMKCDRFYINFTKYIGFVTRLEKKHNRNEEYIEKFIKIIGTKPIIKKLEELVLVKDNLLLN